MASQSGSGNASAGDVDAFFTQAVASYSAGNIVEAERLCIEIQSLDSTYAHALGLLSAIRVHQNRLDEALTFSTQAVALAPDDATLINGYADVLNRTEKPSEALAKADMALGLRPDFAEAYINRGIALTAQYRFTEARKAFDRALSLNPNLKAIVLGNLALLHGEEGQYETSRKYSDAVAAENPGNYAYAFIRYRFSMYTPSVTRREERERTETVWICAPAIAQPVHRQSPPNLVPDRKLKVGYFSSDFKRHPVAMFLEPVLARHDRAQFETRLYDTTPNPDAFSEVIKGLADGYHCGLNQADEVLAQTIADDGVDILVDLTGLFQNCRLNVFRYRPAPVQASWIGYSGTSGLEEMDYVIADKHVCPSDADADFVESIIRLPDHYLCFEAHDVPMLPAGAWSPRPAGVTFGSFNNHMKLNSDVVRVWAEIIKRVPNSRLYLKAPKFGNSELRQHIRKQFEARGVDRGRLTFSGPVDAQAHLNAYNEIDIALDPFPYCGTTTTVDALSMGVPVVTLVGERWVQRTSYSFLTGMGWDSLCASSEQEYMDIAIKLAQNRTQLQGMKAKGRQQFLASPMCDPDRFTRNLETAYQTMWKDHCSSVRP